MLFVGSNHDGLVIKDTLGLSGAIHQSQNNRDSQVNNKLEAPIVVKLPDPTLGFDHPLETHAVDVPLPCSAPVSLCIMSNQPHWETHSCAKSVIDVPQM